MRELPAECCVERPPASSPITCPACRKPGRKVDEITLRALLKPAALERRSELIHRFCATPDCSIVYFGGEEIFERKDLSVPVFQKEVGDTCPVCYCFGISVGDIRGEIAAAGRSTAPDRIRRLVEAARCACEIRNPQGSCCLGNVAKVINKAGARVCVEAGRSDRNPGERGLSRRRTQSLAG